MKLSLRPIRAEDRPFLQALFASTREQLIASIEESPVEQETLMNGQYHAQMTDYTVNYPQASFDLVLENEHPVGRLFVDRRPAEIRVLDISLAPEARNRGIGTRLMRSLLDEGARVKKPVTIHVATFNPDAFRFYQRLGFAPVRDIGTHVFMVWVPPGHRGPVPG